MAFGKRKVTSESGSTPAPPPLPAAPVDSDGVRRVFGEAVYAKHGEWLDKLGLPMGRAENILPDQAELSRRVQRSREIGEERLREHQAMLLARHGCNAVQPFHMISEGVFRTELGTWLMLSMDLLPYAPWNTLYLPTDQPTARALNWPLHPQCSLAEIDANVLQTVGTIRRQLLELRTGVDRALARDPDMTLIERYNAVHAKARGTINDYVKALAPAILASINTMQRTRAQLFATGPA